MKIPSACFFQQLLVAACYLVLGSGMQGAAANDQELAGRKLRAVGTEVGLNGLSPQDAEIAAKLFIGEALKGSKFTVEYRVVRDQRRILEGLIAGDIDTLGMTAMEFFRWRQYLLQAPLFAGAIGDETKGVALLLVREDSGVQSIERLRGKRIAMTFLNDFHELFIDVELLRKGLPRAQRFFSHIAEGATGSSAVTDLYFGKTDAAVIWSHEYRAAVELNPAIERHTRVLASSIPYTIHLVALRKGINDAAERALFEHIFTSALNVTQRGKHMRSMANITSYRKIEASDLDPVAALLSERERLISSLAATKQVAARNRSARNSP